MVIEKHKVGRLGEEIANRLLLSKGYSVLDRNYLKKCGELDIIAEKQGKIHFVEVKTITGGVSCENDPDGITSVSREKYASDRFRAEDNVHSAKLARMYKTIQLYQLEKHVSCEKPWQIDVITVILDQNTKKAKVNMIENITI